MDTDFVVQHYRRLSHNPHRLYGLKYEMRKFQDEFEEMDISEEFSRLNYLMCLVIDECGGAHGVSIKRDDEIYEMLRRCLDKVKNASRDEVRGSAFMPEYLQFAIEQSNEIMEMAKIHLFGPVRDKEFIQNEASVAYRNFIKAGEKLKVYRGPYSDAQDIECMMQIYEDELLECSDEYKFIIGESKNVSKRLSKFICDVQEYVEKQNTVAE